MSSPRESRLLAFAAKRRGFLRRQQHHAEFEGEIHGHLQPLAERFVAQGMSKEEAAAAARRGFGNTTVLQEDRRELQTLPWIESLWRDLRFGPGALRKNPGFTAITVLTLALGIGASTTVFSLVNAVLIRSLPYPHPDRLVYHWSPNPRLQLSLAPSPRSPAGRWRLRWRAA